MCLGRLTESSRSPGLSFGRASYRLFRRFIASSPPTCLDDPVPTAGARRVISDEIYEVFVFRQPARSRAKCTAHFISMR